MCAVIYEPLVVAVVTLGDVIGIGIPLNKVLPPSVEKAMGLGNLVAIFEKLVDRRPASVRFLTLSFAFLDVPRPQVFQNGAWLPVLLEHHLLCPTVESGEVVEKKRFSVDREMV